MNVWRLITHHEDKMSAWLWSKDNLRITIGWGNIGDIGKQGYSSAKEINKAIYKSYPKVRSTHGGPSLWSFYAKMQKGDLVILKTNRFEAVIKVKGDYEWNDTPLVLKNGKEITGEHFHQRLVELTNYNPEQLWESVDGMVSGENIQRTLILCGHNPLESDPS